MKFFSAYDGRDRERSGGGDPVIDDAWESQTVQAHAEDADLNVLMKRFGVTGMMPQNPVLPEYGDYSEVRDFRSAWEAVRAAEQAFMEIPADVRARFDNDPQKFLEFCSNPANLPAMRELKLLKEVSSGQGGEGGVGGRGVSDGQAVRSGQGQSGGASGGSEGGSGGGAADRGGGQSRGAGDAGAG